jgi:hypothetical protein
MATDGAFLWIQEASRSPSATTGQLQTWVRIRAQWGSWTAQP